MTKQKSLSLLTMIFVGLPLSAFALPSSLNMTCAQAVALVQSRGAVVLSTGPGLFDRYVSSGVYCGSSSSENAAWIPTQDTSQCMVGAVCGPPNQNGSN